MPAKRSRQTNTHRQTNTQDGRTAGRQAQTKQGKYYSDILLHFGIINPLEVSADLSGGDGLPLCLAQVLENELGANQLVVGHASGQIPRQPYHVGLGQGAAGGRAASWEGSTHCAVTGGRKRKSNRKDVVKPLKIKAKSLCKEQKVPNKQKVPHNWRDSTKSSTGYFYKLNHF